MRNIRWVNAVLVLFLVACGGQGPTTEAPSTPAPTLPGVPTTPVPTPVDPEPNPTPTPGGVPYYGEWIVTFTSDLGTSFVHALQITDDVSTAGLKNAGGGLQEFCIQNDADDCGSTFASGFGFIGNLVLDDGTEPLSMGIFTQYSTEDPELKIFTLEPISITTNGQGQQTFTVDAAWVLSPGDFADGTITATNIGTPRTLQNSAQTSLDSISDYVRELQGAY